MFTRTLFKSTMLAAALAASLPSHATDFYVVVPVKNRTATPGNLTVTLNPFGPPAAEVDQPYAGFDFNQALQVQGDPAMASSAARRPRRARPASRFKQPTGPSSGCRLTRSR